MLNQNQTPLLDTLKTFTNNPHVSFYTPGHKRGVGASQDLINVFGKEVFRNDLSELTELDNLFAANGVIQQAQALAAEAFGASHTWFLVNGSTCGIEAAILATCGDGDKIILPRNVHSSVIAGLILAGAVPIFLIPEYDAILDITHSITPGAVKAALEEYPDTKAVLIVYPTYYGVCGDVEAIASITHKYNIPLLVDEAHGAHFAFHHQLPISALAAGADLTVQSIHKTLGALTQASMLHIQGNKIDINRLHKALQLVQSSSPSYILLASLDAARHQMALYGKQLISRTLELADIAINNISQIPGLKVLQRKDLDKTRLTITVSSLGLTGFEADDILETQLGIRAEFSSLQHLTFIISLGNTKEDIQQLITALTKLPPGQRSVITTRIANVYSQAMSPRQAFFAATETLPLKETCDRISAEIISPYPPGIPLLMPGEIITKSILDYLEHIQAMGGFINGFTDAESGNIQVVKI